MKIIVIGLMLTGVFSDCFESRAYGQQGTSFGPGKGPAVAGTGYKHTYPQPPKPTVYSMKSIRPAYQVPENPEKYKWLLTTRVDGREPASPSEDVPVYGFLSNGQRVMVGYAKSGEEIILEEIRPLGKATYYGYPWKAPSAAETSASSKRNEKQPTEFWVSGSNIEFAGAK